MTAEAGRALLARLDSVIEERQVAGESDNTPRAYVGASAIGKDCNRERWYDFRWASSRKFEGRLLRLFDRGHKEESRLLQWLDMVGAEVRQFTTMLWWSPVEDTYQLLDWDADRSGGVGAFVDVTNIHFHRERAKAQGVELKQWSFKGHAGHFSGHSDGKARYVPGQEQFVAWDEWIGLEFKTHSAKNFAALAGSPKDRAKWLAGTGSFPGQGVAAGYPSHMIQSQHYMHRLGLRLTLYAGVNKDDDDIHFEFLPYDVEYFNRGEPIIREVIHSPRHPKRISNHPTWFVCKMCDHYRTCHFGEPMQTNCRTCVFSHPVEDGQWKCRKWGDAVIPFEAQLKGCHAWTEIKD